MKRLRITLALLLVALTVPIGLLISRALASVELEQRVRHEAVAERIFDEMERTLSDFLAREEARSPDAYRFYHESSHAVQRAGTNHRRSPLSRPAPEPFVIAHFQIDPDGSLHTPLRPTDMAAATKAGDWPAPVPEREAIERAIEVLNNEVAPFWRDAEIRRRAVATRLEPDQISSVGETDPLRKDRAKRKGEATKARISKQESIPRLAGHPPMQESLEQATRGGEQASAYDVLQSLNVGVKKRAERRQKGTDFPPDNPPAYGETKTDFEQVPIETTAADAPTRAAGAIATAAPIDSSRHRSAAPFMPSSPGRRSSSEDRVRIVLEPMVGRPLGDRYLMLYRTVLVGNEGFRQGLLLDRAALGAWLTDQVIGDGPLAELATIRFGADEPLTALASHHLAGHRFAEPFAGLEASIRIGPLRQSSSATDIHLLAVLLAGVAVLGGLAVHRMASVVVEFAERRNNFVAAVSHELKTPLTAIRMHGEMLRDGLVASETKREEYYRTITDESERLSRLIDNVLEFSRLEKGGRALTTTVGSPAPVVADIVDRLRPHAEREGFTLRSEITEPLPAVRFDRDALVQMIFNLIDNAIKYAAGCDRKEITIRCEASEDGGVVVSVRDFGPGVPREHIARIFEPFFRVEEELTRTTQGSGIGLSLVKQLGDAMRATVVGDNPEGGGFRVRIAFAPASP